MQGWPPEMQRGGPRCKNHSCFHSFGRHAKRRADMQGWPPEMQKKNCISDGQPCMSALLFYCFTNLRFYYFTPLQIQYCRGRCLGLAARDAKTNSTYYHVLQQNVVFASRTANLACRPSYSTVLLFYYFTFSLHARDAKNVFASRTAKLACRPSYSTVLLIYYFTSLLQIQYCRGRCLGLARDAKKFSTYYHTYYHILPRTWYYHVLQKNVVFASRTANRARRPSYSTVLLFYYLRYSTAVADVWGWPPEMQKKICISDGQRCMSALLFIVLLICYLLFYSRYSTAAADVWGWPPEMRKKNPRTTMYYHILPRTTTYYSRT